MIEDRGPIYVRISQHPAAPVRGLVAVYFVRCEAALCHNAIDTARGESGVEPLAATLFNCSCSNGPNPYLVEGCVLVIIGPVVAFKPSRCGGTPISSDVPV